MKTRIAARSTAAILSVCGLLGLFFVVLAVVLVARHETQRQEERLHDLLNTVENTVQIACFLQDRELASEVAAGLMKNSTVAGVRIEAGDLTLASSGVADEESPTPASREQISERPAFLEQTIYSPFNPEEALGTVTLVPNRSEIQSLRDQAVFFVFTLLLVQLAIIGIATVFIVVRLVTRPIAKISHRLHKLQAETGEKLRMPRGNEMDEIGQLVTDVNAMIDYLVHILNDEKALRRQRELEEKKFRAIFENAETGLFQADMQGRILSHNPAFLGIFQQTAESAPDHLQIVVGDKEVLIEERIRQCLEQGERQELEMLLGEAGGRWLHLIFSPVGDGIVQGVVNDITERKLAEQEAEARATTDSLTRLGNRAGFEKRLSGMLKQSRSTDEGFALVMLDLDHFKAVNDTHGHQAGDLLLQVIAARLRECGRESDYIARLGGDEFVLLLQDVRDQKSAARIGQAIIEAVDRPINIGEGIEVKVGASIGIAFSDAAHDADEIVRQADAAMYRAKHKGRHQYCFAEATGSADGR